MSLSLFHYLLYSFAYRVRRFFGVQTPFIGGLVLNSSCNMACPQCRASSGADRSGDPSFAEVCAGLDGMRRRGIRNLAITGGEPFFWSDGDRTVRDVIAYARKNGFMAVTVYTNGTFPLDCDCDTVFVSIDGPGRGHDKLRGDGVFGKIEENFARTAHPNIILNFTINSGNFQELEEMCRYAAAHPKIAGIFFYFHTPYYGVDELFQPMPVKAELTEELLRLKNLGYPIRNSAAALRAFIRNRWKRPSDLCIVWERGRFFQCCRSLSGGLGCPECGYLGYLELQEIMKLKPSAILDAMRYIR